MKLTKTERTKAIAAFARRQGFSAASVRATTCLRNFAYEAYLENRAKRSFWTR